MCCLFIGICFVLSVVNCCLLNLICKLQYSNVHINLFHNASGYKFHMAIRDIASKTDAKQFLCQRHLKHIQWIRIINFEQMNKQWCITRYSVFINKF